MRIPTWIVVSIVVLELTLWGCGVELKNEVEKVQELQHPKQISIWDLLLGKPGETIKIRTPSGLLVEYYEPGEISEHEKWKQKGQTIYQ